MSYLAMSAAPIDDENNISQKNESSISKKKYQHNKTQKYRTSSNEFNSEKVNSVLQSIHNNTSEDDELGNYSPKGSIVSAKHSDDFKPINPYDFPSNPVSMGGERIKDKEGMSTMNNEDSNVPQPTHNDTLKLQELQSAFMNDAQVRDYYRKLTPTSRPNNLNNLDNNKNYYTSTSSIFKIGRAHV